MQQIDPRELRRALGAFMTGVTVVTTIDEQGAPTGFTANSFTSVSLDEPLVLFCLAANSSNRDIYLNAGKFAVNILTEGQQSISGVFASPHITDRFANVTWRTARTGSPVLDGVAAWFDCVLHNTVEAGDHVIVIGRVLAFDHCAANPLGYWKGSYVSALLEHRASEASLRKGYVGVVLEHDGKILLVEDEKNDQLKLPCAAYMGTREQPDSLLGMLAGYGINAEISFVFSVFEGCIPGESKNMLVYYRGTVESFQGSSVKAHWYTFKTIPWERLPNKETDTMLHRYIHESLGGRYSVYVGDSERGKVRTVR